jgi:hypothetical protein
MTNREKFGLGVLALLASFAFGRFAAPEHERIETQVIEVEKIDETKQTETERNRHRKTVITEVTKPDGSKEKRTEIEENAETSKKTDQQASTARTNSETTSKEIDRSSSKITVSALVGAPVSFGSYTGLIYGGHVSRPLLGPIAVGVWGFSTGIGGFSLGLAL